MLNIFRPAAVAVAKSVILGCRSATTAARLASLPVSFGCGNARVDVDGWTAAKALTAWGEGESPRFSSITAATYTADGWFEAILLTSSARGVDFRINFLVDGAEELVMDAVHRVVTTGKAGEISFSWDLPVLGARSIGPIALPSGTLAADIQDEIDLLAGISTGDITASVTTQSTGYTISFEYAGQFAGLDINLVEVDDADLLSEDSDATIIRVQDGSPGADHKFKLEYAAEVLPVTEYSDEIQEIYADSPAPVSGTFVIEEVSGYMTGDTAAIDWDATAGEVAAALTTAGLTDFAASGGPLNSAPVRITWSNGENIPEMTLDNSGLTVAGDPPVMTITELVKGTPAGSGVNAKHLFQISNLVTSGTFGLDYDGLPSPSIPYNVSAASFKTLLESTLSGATVTVTGTSLVLGFTVEYGGAYAATPVDLPTEQSYGLGIGITASASYVQQGGGGIGTEVLLGSKATGATYTTPSGRAWRFTPVGNVTSYVLTLNGYSYTVTLGKHSGHVAKGLRDLMVLNNEPRERFTYAVPPLNTNNPFPTKVHELTIGFACPLGAYLSSMPMPSISGVVGGGSISVTELAGQTLEGKWHTWPQFTVSLNSKSVTFDCADITDIRTKIAAELGSGWGRAFGECSPSTGRGHGILLEFASSATFSFTGTVGSPNTGTVFTIAGGNKIVEAEPSSVRTIIQYKYLGGTPSEGYFGINGNLAAAPYNVSNTNLANLLAAIAGTTGANMVMSAGPLPAAVNASYPSSLGLVPLPTVAYTWRAVGGLTITEDTAGASGAEDINEIQRLEFEDTTGGTFTLDAPNTTTTSALTYPSSAPEIQAALRTAQGSTAISVTGNVGGPYDIEFTDSLGGTDIADLLFDDSSLEGTSTAYNYLTRTITQGGTGTVTGGMTGGYFDLRFTYTPSGGTEQVKNVLNIPYNPSNATLKSMIEAVLGVTVTVTGGTLPDTAVQIELTDDLGNISFEVEVTPHINLVEGPTLSTEVLRSAQLGVVEHVYDLVIVPGTDTPGINYTASDDLTYIWLYITEPGGLVSDMLEPEDPLVDLDLDGELDEEMPRTRLPSVVRIDWPKLTADLLEQTINEAFGKTVCRVTQPVQTVVHCDKFVNVPTASTVGTQAVALKCWYNKSIFRIVFVNDYADPSTISSIEIRVPERVDGEPAKMQVRDFMNVPDGSENSGRSTVEENQATDGVDGAAEAARIAGCFYMAELAGEPLHRFEIYPSSGDGLLSWNFRLMEHNVASSSNFPPQLGSTNYGISDRIREMRIQFHWVSRSVITTSGVQSGKLIYTPLMSSRFVDWDATAGEIQAAIGEMLTDWPGIDNVLVEGSLYESWLTDTYDPRDDADGTIRGLKVTFVGDLAHLPYNEYELDLIMSTEVLPLESDHLNNSINERLYFYRSSLWDGTRASSQKLSMLHWEGRLSVPVPPFENQRIRLTASGTTPVTLSVNGQQVTVLVTDTAAQLKTKLLNALGSYPHSKQVGLPIYEWDNETGDWDVVIGSSQVRWNPSRFAESVFVSGRTLATGPMEIEFCGAGLQYQDADIATGILEYEVDPIEITTITQGAPSRSCIQVLTLPASAVSGSIVIAGDTLTHPFNVLDLEGSIDISTDDCAVTVSGSVYTITFAGTGSHALLSLTSDLYEEGSVAVSVTSEGGLDGTLVIQDKVAGAGPAWFNNPNNWSQEVAPSSDQELLLDDSIGNILYGIDQKATFSYCAEERYVFHDRVDRFREGVKVLIVHDDLSGYKYIRNPSPDGTFSLSTTSDGALLDVNVLSATAALANISMEVYAVFTNRIGLPATTGDIPEYLPRYLKAEFVMLELGAGEGSGLQRGHFDCCDAATEVQVLVAETGSVPPALQFLFNDAAASIDIDSASVGIAYAADEESVLGTINGTVNTELYVNRGVTYSTLETGGPIVHYPGNTIIH